MAIFHCLHPSFVLGLINEINCGTSVPVIPYLVVILNDQHRSCPPKIPLLLEINLHFALNIFVGFLNLILSLPYQDNIKNSIRSLFKNSCYPQSTCYGIQLLCAVPKLLWAWPLCLNLIKSGKN